MEALRTRLIPDGSPPRLLHWSQAETVTLETAYNAAMRRHPQRGWPRLPWFDLLSRVVRAEPLAVRGALGFGLKEVANALHALGRIETSWGDGPTDGLGAMVATWSAAAEARQRGVPLHEVELMQEVERYNEVDCRALAEIVAMLRERH